MEKPRAKSLDNSEHLLAELSMIQRMAELRGAHSLEDEDFFFNIAIDTLLLCRSQDDHPLCHSGRIT